MRIPAEEIIPQRKPFILVDELLFCDGTTSVTSFQIKESSIFSQEGLFETAGIVENMAQTSVAGIGYQARFVNNAPVTVGYLGNVRNLKVHRRPKVGETLTTTVTVKSVIGDITLSEARTAVGEELIAEATLKTAQEG